MKIEIDLKIILLIIVFFLTSQIEIYGIFILFIFLHELAHILVGVALGFRVESINLNIFGFSAEFYAYKSKKSYIKIITYLAGPILNLIFVLFFYFYEMENELALKLIYTNIILCIFNMFPILPLDGGKILQEILKKFLGNVNSNIVMNMVTKFFLIMISFIYGIAIIKIKNIAILFLIIYLWYLYSIEEKKLNTLKRVYELIEKS